MKALTLTQPWASLMADGLKRVETRSWRSEHRGLLAIHSATHFPAWARAFAEEERALGRVPGRVIRLDYQQRAIQDLFGKVNAIEGGAREAIRFMLGQDGFISVGRLTDALGGSNVQWGKLVKALKDQGYVSQGGISGGGSGYKPRLREWVADELAPHSPSDREVEDVYQAVLGRVAGEVVVG